MSSNLSNLTNKDRNFFSTFAFDFSEEVHLPMRFRGFTYHSKTTTNLVNLAFGISYLQEQQANVSLKPSAPQLPLSNWLLALTRSLFLQEREGEQAAWSTDMHGKSAMLERERERESNSYRSVSSPATLTTHRPQTTQGLIHLMNPLIGKATQSLYPICRVLISFPLVKRPLRLVRETSCLHTLSDTHPYALSIL